MRPLHSFCIAVLWLLFILPADAQDPIMSALRGQFTDLAELRAKAEAGDANAQLTWAKTLDGGWRKAEALYYYQKALQQGQRGAIYPMGKMLWRGAGGNSATNSVKAEPHVGVQLIFFEATNRNHEAYYDMHRAYAEGLGVPQDTVQAYAWLLLHMDSVSSILAMSRQNELNAIALGLDTAACQTGKRLAAEYKAGRWPVLQVKAAATPSKAASTPSLAGLKLSGIVLGKSPLAIINGKTFSEGQEIMLPLKPTPVRVKCIRIEDRMVTVSLDGDPTEHRLGLN